MSHHDHCDSNHEHDHKHSAHDGHDHDHEHEHIAVDPGELIAEKSPQDQLLIATCAIAMTLLMICMGTWMQIPTPTGSGHQEHSEAVHVEHAPKDATNAPVPTTNAVPESHETQSH